MQDVTLLGMPLTRFLSLDFDSSAPWTMKKMRGLKLPQNRLVVKNCTRLDEFSREASEKCDQLILMTHSSGAGRIGSTQDRNGDEVGGAISSIFATKFWCSSSLVLFICYQTDREPWLRLVPDGAVVVSSPLMVETRAINRLGPRLITRQAVTARELGEAREEALRDGRSDLKNLSSHRWTIGASL